VPVSTGVRFTRIFGGATLCGLTDDGRMQCGLMQPSSSARMTVALHPVLESHADIVSYTVNRGCGLTASGDVYCEGGMNTGDSYQTSPPQPENRGIAMTRISADSYHSCGIDRSGSAWCWGWNEGDKYIPFISGELGNGTTTNSFAPTPVAGGLRFADITVGGAHGCGITTDGRAWCWGRNFRGDLGIGVTGPNSLVPVPVLAAPMFSAIVSGSRNCALATDGTVWCWGGTKW
jgi:alpha-tubulin suppressor-like RCC1 family protein